jgi:hypothetical protein
MDGSNGWKFCCADVGMIEQRHGKDPYVLEGFQ